MNSHPTILVTSDMTSAASLTASVLVMLALMLGSVFVLAWLGRHVRGRLPRRPGDALLEVLGEVSLDRRGASSIRIVRAGDEFFLLVTQSSATAHAVALQRLDGDAVHAQVAKQNREAPAAPSQDSFVARVARVGRAAAFLTTCRKESIPCSVK